MFHLFTTHHSLWCKMCWKVNECQYLHGLFFEGRRAKCEGDPNMGSTFCHQALSHHSQAGLSCLAFLDEVRQYDNSAVLPGTSGNSTRQHKVFVGRIEQSSPCCRQGFMGFSTKTECLCCKGFSTDVLSRYLYSDYPWLWLKTGKFCYGSNVWITTEVFACVLMTPE